jgi:integrase
MPKLTKKMIESSQPLANKIFYLWDSEIRGFGCQVLPSGRKTYYFIYRNLQKKAQRLKIGVHGNITCEIAREIALGWAGDVARSKDPKEERMKAIAQEKKSIKIREFADLYFERYANIRKKPRSIKEDKGLLRSRILPALGDKKISDIIQEDVLRLQASMKHLKVRGNRCIALLNKMFNLAENWNFREKGSNPCYRVEKAREHKREKFLTQGEIQKLEEVLKMEESVGSLSPSTIAAIRLLLYTGCRLNEILTLKWKNVFLEEKYIYLKDAKNGERVVPLNQVCIDLLKKLKKQGETPYVLRGARLGKHIVNIQNSWKKIRNLTEVQDTRIHDLRHTFASLAIKQGLDLYRISKLLGHRNIQTTTRYAHIAKNDLIESAEVVGKVFEEILSRPYQEKCVSTI